MADISKINPNGDIYDIKDTTARAGLNLKADKVLNATANNFATLDSNGNLTDSGKKASDFMASDGVVANPTGTATGTLTKLGIGSDIYDIQGGGSGGIDGSTVTPTDVVATWLACAGLHQSYTTIGEVLADSGVLYALINSTNAVDYMVRSTTWASSIVANQTAIDYIVTNDYSFNILFNNSTWRSALTGSTYFASLITKPIIPVMTGNSAPSGVASGSNSLGGNFDYYKAFDRNEGTKWCLTNTGAITDKYLQYKFANKIRAYKAKIKFDNYISSASYKIQGSEDGTSFVDLTSAITSLDGEVYLSNVKPYLYFRLYISSQSLTVGDGNAGRVCEFQLYSYESIYDIDEKADKTDIAPVENGTTASRAYAIGQQFYLSDGKLYRCKQPIAQGATFTIGTNCELAPSITDQIKALWDAINS